jgi:hypothetical protein
MQSKAEKDLQQKIYDKQSREHCDRELNKIIERDLKKGRR